VGDCTSCPHGCTAEILDYVAAKTDESAYDEVDRIGVYAAYMAIKNICENNIFSKMGVLVITNFIFY